MPERVAVNEDGRIVGQHHHRATIPDEVVAEMRRLHEREQMRYRAIIELFKARGLNLRYPTVKKICNYERRAHRVEGYREVRPHRGAAGGTQGSLPG